MRITQPLPDVTGLLLAWRGGDEEALSRLIPAIERELHRIARRCMAGERGGHSLQATALVNEAYIRLIDVRQMDWQNGAHMLTTVGTKLLDFGLAKLRPAMGAASE